MKKQLSIIASCLLLMAGSSFAANEVLSFNDNNGTPNAGTYNSTDSFSLSVSAAWTGYSSFGLSYWLQVPTAIAPMVSITGVTYFTFPDGNNTGPATVLFATTGAGTGADAGFILETRDLGATTDDTSNPGNATAPGTYQTTTFTFNLNGLAPGVYLLKTTSVPSRTSQITDTNFVSHSVPAQAIYTITVVPEPATWSLMGLGGLGAFGLTWLRARRK